MHLAGEGIAEKKWTPGQKRRILESRTKGTDLLARTIAGRDEKPAVLVSASAIGYYGNRGDDELTEVSPPGDDFLAGVCVQWEAATAPAAEAGVRVVIVRTGIVLSPKGGVLKQLLLPFKLGVGGRTGSGHQYMSWITPGRRGPRDRLRPRARPGARPAQPHCTEPGDQPRAHERRWRTCLHRPAVLPTPLPPLKVRYGSELVENLLVNGQRVLPAALATAGFEFVAPRAPPRPRRDPRGGLTSRARASPDSATRAVG